MLPKNPKSKRPAPPAPAKPRPEPTPPEARFVSTPDEPELVSTTVDARTAPRPHHFGLATLTGQPNVGKSTLLNRLVGEKLAIVSPRPQTTRDRIQGIFTARDTQIVFLDTPGIHKARSPLNRAMVGTAIESLETVDVVVLVIDAPQAVRWLAKTDRRPHPAPVEPHPASVEPRPNAVIPLGEPGEPVSAEEEEAIADEAEAIANDAEVWRVPLDHRIPPGDRRIIHNILRYNRKWLIALNKVDCVKPRLLLPVMEALATAPSVGPLVPISARTGDGVAQLVEAIRSYLPEGEPEYAPDELTDRSLRFLCAELVREQVFLQIREEVPYGVAVEIEVFDELPDLTHIQALVHVEKAAQRGILLGKGGLRMKELATQARLQMQNLLDRKVFLEVHVHVEPEWSERMETLKQFGYLL